jgi:hypothetical protein
MLLSMKGMVMEKIIRLVFSLGMLLLSYVSFHFAFAQETIEIALRDIEEGLETLDAYRQHHIVTTKEDETVTIQNEWLHTVTASGDESALITMPAFGQETTEYIIGGKYYSYVQMGEEASCFEMAEPGLGLESLIGDISDLTGLHTATLVTEGETINETLTNHYRFDPPRTYEGDPRVTTGDLWLAREGGYIVRYIVESFDGEAVTTRWEYNVGGIDTSETITLPSPCLNGEG